MNNFVKALIFVAAAIGGIIASTLIANRFKEPVPVEIVPNNENVQVVLCPKDFSGYGALPKDQVVQLIDKKTRAYAANGRFVNPTIIIAKRGGLGSEVACGYLYIKTGTESVGPLRDWENIYINPNPYGGHIIKDKSISSKDGEKIYHLPFDQQYDRTIIGDCAGEFHAFTVKEAEDAGFRRAFKHRF